MNMNIIEFLSRKYPSLVMLVNYTVDFKRYRKYNIANKKNTALAAFEGKIFRQTHTIEKGMSVSKPRKGFGKEKIRTLLEYLGQFEKAGYARNNIAYVNAVQVLYRYVDFQKALGFEPLELEAKLKELEINRETAFECGVKRITKADIIKSTQGDFKELFLNRHSVRQFSDEPIDIEKVKLAVKLAMKAPSACNRQSPKVYLFQEEDTNAKLGKIINGNTGFEDEVQKYLVITSDICSYMESYERNQMYVDGALFAMSLALSLEYYGIASCFLQNSESRPLDKRLRSVTKIPENETIVVFLAIGNYKEEFNVAISKRKNMEEVFKII